MADEKQVPVVESGAVDPNRYPNEVYPNSTSANVGPTSDPNAPAVDPAIPREEFVRDNEQAATVPASDRRPFNEQADEWLAGRQADQEKVRGTGDWVEDYPDWTVWQTDDGKGVWHAGHKNSVDYYQVGSEDDLKTLLGDYGKDNG